MKIILSFLISAVSIASFSQIVNIENKRFNDDKQGFSGGVELNFDFTMNSNQLLKIGDEVQVSYLKKKHQFLLITDHAFIKSGDNDFENRGFQHFRYIHKFKDSGKLSFEAFQQIQFNKIQKIDLRLIGGAGLRLNLINEAKYQLFFGTGFMAEHEELIGVGISQDVLSTSYLSFGARFNDNIGFSTIAYIQPKLISLGDYRFANETSLRFTINKYLNYKIVYSVIHDNREIPGARKTNYTIENALEVRF